MPSEMANSIGIERTRAVRAAVDTSMGDIDLTYCVEVNVQLLQAYGQ